MKLYHITTLPPTSRHAVVDGSFTAARQQELAIATGSTLELYRLLPKESKLDPLFRVNVFANIVKLATFRLPATRRDFLLVTSDAGTLSILTADEPTRTFKKIHCETLGKTGMRRIAPLQYLASDPRGRACMVGALEKIKLCFVLNRDSDENLTISSALEANKSNTATFSIIGIDVGFENPVFAALERSYDLDATKQLVYYELDLGLNHIIRKAATPVRESTTTMVPVPGHSDGPGGVILISSDHITYRNLLGGRKKTDKLDCALPFRQGTDPSDGLIVSSTLYHDKKRKAFFFMICTENGDLLKIDVRWNVEVGVEQLTVAYFDTLTAPATSMSIFRAGYLCAAMEGNDSVLLRFENVEVKEGDPAGGWSTSSAENPNTVDGALRTAEEDEPSNLSNHHIQKRPRRSITRLEFSPRSNLKNLSTAETHRALNSLLQVHATRDAFGRPQLMAAAGRSKGGSFCILRRGVSLVDITDHVKLPFRAEHVFSFGDRTDSRHHSFIVVSSRRQTVVLRIQDGTIQESSNFGFEQSTRTVFAGVMSSRSLVQVHSDGVRFFPDGSISDATEWKPPSNVTIVMGSGNIAQLIIALSSGTLVYFEVDEESGQLTEINQLLRAVSKPDTGNGPTPVHTNDDANVSLCIQETPPGRIKASFFAAADGVSNRVRLFRVGTTGKLESLGLQITSAPVCSLSIVDFGKVTSGVSVDSRTHEFQKQRNQRANDREGYEPLICLVSGTSNGVVTRAIIDPSTGDFMDKRPTFVGLEPVRTAAFRIRNIPICLVLSKESVLFRRQGGIIRALPLLTTAFHHAAPLSSRSFGSGIVATTGSILRFLAFDTSEMFSSSGIRVSSLSPSTLPTKLHLDLNFDLKRISLLGTPRRIIPLTLGPDAHLRQKPTPTEQNHPIPAFILLETDRTKSQHSSGTEKESKDSENSRERESSQGETQPSQCAAWSSNVQIFKSVGRKGQDSVGSIEVSDDGLILSDSITLPGSSRILHGVSTTFSAGREVPLGGAAYTVLSVARSRSHDTLRASANQDNESCNSGYLLTYRVDVTTCKLSLLHETALSEPACSVVSFRDMIAVGCGRSIELYALGKKKLLKKAEVRNAVANKVVAMAATGSDRLFVGDIRESVTVYRFLSNRESDPMPYHRGRLVPMGTDSVPRWISSMIPLDYSSVVCGDKFGNIVVLRLSKSRSSTLGGAPEGSLEHTSHNGVGAVNDILVPEACVHVGSTVTGLTLASPHARPINGEDVLTHSSDAIIFATIDGLVGALVPLRRQSEVHIAQSIESMMRRKQTSLCGRDHVSFRSSFGPVKNVIDGDLCETFHGLTWEGKVECAKQAGRSVEDIVYDLEELRSSAM